MTNSNDKKCEFRIRYPDGDTAGWCRDTGSILWRGGTKWLEASYPSKKMAQSDIEDTNRYRKSKGYPITKYKIVRVEVV